MWVVVKVFCQGKRSMPGRGYGVADRRRRRGRVEVARRARAGEGPFAAAGAAVAGVCASECCRRPGNADAFRCHAEGYATLARNMNEVGRRSKRALALLDY